MNSKKQLIQINTVISALPKVCVAGHTSISIRLICLHIRPLILSITLIRKLRIFCVPQWFEPVKICYCYLYAMLKINLVYQLDLIKAADFITGFTSRHYRQHKANMNVHNIDMYKVHCTYRMDGQSCCFHPVHSSMELCPFFIVQNIKVQIF